MIIVPVTEMARRSSAVQTALNADEMSCDWLLEIVPAELELVEVILDAATQATMKTTNTRTSELSQAYVISLLGLRIKQHIERLKSSVQFIAMVQISSVRCKAI